MPGRISELHIVDPLLSTIARGYSNEEYIGDELFPVVNVDKESGQIPLFGKDQFRVWESLRALRGDSNKMDGMSVGKTPYFTDEHDLVQPLDKRELEEAPWALETRAVETVMNAIMLKREVMQAALAQDLNTYPTANKTTMTDDFLNEDAIDPIEYLKNKKFVLVDIIGKDPNTMEFGYKVWQHLMLHPKIKGYLNVSVGGQIVFNTIANIQKISDLLEIKNIIVGKSKYTEDMATFKPIWTNNIIMAYITPPSGIDRTPYEPCFGYTLRKKGHPYSDTWWENNGKVKQIRTTDNFDIKVVGAESALIINNPIDPTVYSL